MRVELARALAWLAAAASCALAGCGGGSGRPGSSAPPPAGTFLEEADVRAILARAVFEAQARGLHAHVAVVDVESEKPVPDGTRAG